MPIRVQRKRTKGWKMPENTVVVTRGTIWGNPFIVNPNVKPGSKHGAGYTAVPTHEEAVRCYKEMMTMDIPSVAKFKELIRKELRGRNLACFCNPDQPCHADVLLEIANKEQP